MAQRPSNHMDRTDGVAIQLSQAEDRSRPDARNALDRSLNAWQMACSRWNERRLWDEVSSMLLAEHDAGSYIDILKELFLHPSGAVDTDYLRKRITVCNSVVIHQLTTKRDKPEDKLTLHSISQALVSNDLLEMSDQRRFQVYQFIFIFIGWLTMLYSPVLYPRDGCLEVQAFQAMPRLRRRRYYKQQEYVGPDDLEHLATRKFVNLLSRLGINLPEASDQGTMLATDAPNHSAAFFGDKVVSSNLSFYNLARVGHIKIRWTKSISEHLEFDEYGQNLCIFAYPGFCAHICSSDDNSILLDRIFSEYHASDDADDPRQGGGEEEVSEDLCREILWSYRIIFSQDKRSWQDFRRSVTPSVPHPVDKQDPLFRCLISHGWQRSSPSIMTALFADLIAPPLKSVYSASTDFPYLGKRLLRLQDYMNAQNPSDLQTLLYDRRDVLRYWTFWAVVLIGGISILISFIEVLVSIVDVVAQFTS